MPQFEHRYVSERPFALMFHHLTDHERHISVQGALTADAFRAFITDSHGFKIIRAQDWLDRYASGTLSPNEICITFDDSLLSQYEIALPILEEFDLTAIWFVYSSVFEGVPEPFELHRLFRNLCFDSVDDYYAAFFEKASLLYPELDVAAAAGTDAASAYLSTHTFYSRPDRQFRYVRDTILSVAEYDHLMAALMADYGERLATMQDRIWMNNDHLIALRDAGHLIGLHSYSHPVNFRRLDMEQQVSEYFRNAMHLTQVLGTCPTVMAHPSNSYDATTLMILRGFGVQFGFRSDIFDGADSPLEIQRIDHTIFANFLSKE